MNVYYRLVIWAFERFYHEGAWTYDLVAWLISRGYWSRWIEAVMPDLAHMPMLELGCGTGYLQRARQQESCLSVGLDESRHMLRLARRKAPRATFMRAVSQDLPFRDASWAAIVATFPAPYLFDQATLSEIRRVLNPDGTLYIVDGGVVPDGWYQKLVTLIYWLVFGRTVSTTPDQNLTDPRMQRLAEFGFVVTCEWRSVGASQVQILRAKVVSV